MRIYIEPMTMIKEVERDLFEMGVEQHSDSVQDKNVSGNSDYDTLELWGTSYMLTGNYSLFELEDMVLYNKGNLAWCQEEFKERISPQKINPGTAYKQRHEIWSEFLKDNKFAYTYNERYREQIPQIIDELDLHPHSRQAILSMYDDCKDRQNWGGKSRIPCSLQTQYLIRENKLNAIYTMRSCDFLTHFAHDVYLSIRLLDYLSDQLGLSRGWFIHQIGSLHAFKKDLKVKGIF